MSILDDIWDATGGKVVSYVDDVWDATNESGDDTYLERLLDTGGQVFSDAWNYDVPGLGDDTDINLNPITGMRSGLNWIGDALRPITPDSIENWLDNFEAGSPIVQWPDQYLIQPLERIVDAALYPHEQEWVQNLGSWVNENLLGQPSSGVNFTEDDYATLMDQVADMDFGDPFIEDEIIKLAMADLEEEEKEVKTGPSWDPMGLTNLLGDQIGLINQLTQAGLMNAQQWRDTTLDTLDSVYGDLEADFQAQLDGLSERELASIENMGLTTDDIAAELAEMGVERSVLSLEEQAIADAMALQSGNEMDFAQNIVRSAQLGQADRVTSAMNAFNDINMGIQTGYTEQVGQLQNMAQAALVQGQALGVDPAILFADMIYGTGIAEQQMSANASAAANADMMAMAEYLAQTVPDFGGDPMLAYSVLSGQLPGNYFKPTEGSFLDSLEPGVLSLLGDEIQNILLNNQNIRFEDAVRLAEDALYFNPME